MVIGNTKKLSIVVPVYNEIDHIEEVISKIESVDLPIEKEIIIVDDYSTDGTRDYLETLSDTPHKIIFKEKNGGKGSALREGFNHITGDVFVIQDADHEYDINDYHALLAPILQGDADVVYGSRFLDISKFSSPYPLHIINNTLITKFSNIFTGLSLTDMETCYKMMRTDVLHSFKDKLSATCFTIEPEITHHVARGGWRILEVPISYTARTYEEGKKIRMRDGLRAGVHILKLWVRH